MATKNTATKNTATATATTAPAAAPAPAAQKGELMYAITAKGRASASKEKTIRARALMRLETLGDTFTLAQGLEALAPLMEGGVLGCSKTANSRISKFLRAGLVEVAE